MISISLVLYHTPPEQLLQVTESIRNISLPWHLTVVEHSGTPQAEQFCKERGIHYLFSGDNRGYGGGHNRVLSRNLEKYPYHLVLNPDISFGEGVVERLVRFCEEHPEAGMVSPEIVYPGGETQYLCKLLPSPADLFLRRFLPFRSYVEERNKRYEMRFSGYNSVMQVPHMTGCFMLMKRDALKKAGLFDERFFMYLEDVDLSRRFNAVSKVMYVPDVSVTHAYRKGSYASGRLLVCHLLSAVQYFNKWGWFSDRERDELNQLVCQEILKAQSGNKKPPSLKEH